MTGLWEEVESPQALNLISAIPTTLDQSPNISSLSMNVTADVDDSSWSKFQKLVEESIIATFSWGINDDNRLIGREGNLFEKGRCICGHKGGIRDVIGLGVLFGECNGSTRDVDADGRRKQRRQGNREES